MRRRTFIAGLGAAATWPLVARGQQAMPVVGFLGSQSSSSISRQLSAMWDGLKETGFVIDQNVIVNFQWAEDHYDRLPAMAAELVRRRVSVIVASGGNVAAVVAKNATATIPIVFPIVTDPVKGGLVASLNRPGGNLTGVAALTIELDPKRLELLVELVPAARLIGGLIDINRSESDEQAQSLLAAAQTLGRRSVIARVGAEVEFDEAIASLAEQKVDALVISASPLFTSRRDRLILLLARYAIPTINQFSDFAASGGLISYGTSSASCYRQAGIYVGRILKG